MQVPQLLTPESLPCPLCKTLNKRPRTPTKFKCTDCRNWLELRKGATELNDYLQRKNKEGRKKDYWWDAEISKVMFTLDLNHEDAIQHIKDRLSKKSPTKSREPEISTAINPIVALPKSSSQNSAAPWD